MCFTDSLALTLFPGPTTSFVCGSVSASFPNVPSPLLTTTTESPHMNLDLYHPTNGPLMIRTPSDCFRLMRMDARSFDFVFHSQAHVAGQWVPYNWVRCARAGAAWVGPTWFGGLVVSLCLSIFLIGSIFVRPRDLVLWLLFPILSRLKYYKRPDIHRFLY